MNNLEKHKINEKGGKVVQEEDVDVVESSSHQEKGLPSMPSRRMFSPGETHLIETMFSEEISEKHITLATVTLAFTKQHDSEEGL